MILLSGGLDSAANLAFCHSYNKEAGLALTIRYGQRAEAQEVEAASRIAAYYGVPHETVDLPWLGELGGNALTDTGRPIPKPDFEELDQHEVTQKTALAVWVPNRNGVFIQVAAAIAEARGHDAVIVGFNAEEAVTFPDNSSEFIERSNAALAFSTHTKVHVISYTAAMDKKQIVAHLRKSSKPFPFHWVWSCYEGLEHPCRRCESCRRHARAIEGGPPGA